MGSCLDHLELQRRAAAFEHEHRHEKLKALLQQESGLLIGFNSMRNPYLSSCTFQGQNLRVCFETDRLFDEPETDGAVRPMRRDCRLGAHNNKYQTKPFSFE
jgi:hypothetical protein